MGHLDIFFCEGFIEIFSLLSYTEDFWHNDMKKHIGKVFHLWCP